MNADIVNGDVSREARAVMFAKELHKDDHVKRFLVEENGDGWEIRVEEDDAVLRKIRYTDWHRVERALFGFSLQIDALEQTGWRA